MKKLSQIKPNQMVTVSKLLSSGKSKQRLIDMGIYDGVRLKVKKLAPLGDPMEISVKDFTIAIRKSDAEQIIVTE